MSSDTTSDVTFSQAIVLYTGGATLRASCVVTPNAGIKVDNILIQVFDLEASTTIIRGGGGSQGPGTSQPMVALAVTDLYPPSMGAGETVTLQVSGYCSSGSFIFNKNFVLYHPVSE